ncbi:MAG: DnaJ domain-containing protein [Nitrospira sp.]|nr:DnaJ domain-containing protein [Nitrospira sp.]
MARMDYYQLLGVSREASDEEIKKAYRKLVFQHHPDRNPGSAHAEEKIREINTAYEVIGDAEKRRSYDRLSWGDEPRAEALDPGVVLEQMEQKLFDEGRKELFALLMQNVSRIKAELRVLRGRTIAEQGYDSFLAPVVERRAAEIVEEFVTADMQRRAQRLIEVATEMMLSQGVAKRNDEGGVRSLRHRLDASLRNGRLHGIASALELFYERQ